MDLNELLDRAYGNNTQTELEKVAAAEADNRQAAIEVITQAAAARQEDLSGYDFSANPTEHLVKVANALLEGTDPNAATQTPEQEQMLELSPRLQATFAADPEALGKFASLDPDQQHMIVCGDLFGDTAARAFLAGINAQGGVPKVASAQPVQSEPDIDAMASQLAYEHLVSQGLWREGGQAPQASVDEQVLALAQEKVAQYLGQNR